MNLKEDLANNMEYIDLKSQYMYLKTEIEANIQKVLENSSFILGEEVQVFEEKLAEYVGVKHVVSCSDGTSALQLIYMAYGIGKGDAVFCPDMTFIASIEPACLMGATPVFCDINEYFNIDPDSLERQINNVINEGKYRPKAIVAVDFLGNPADYDRLQSIANKYDLLLIEDAAQAMGASYKGKKCGSLGDVAATSFFPSKPLGCYGDGGAVFTNDDKICEILRSLRVHGKGKTKYDNVHIGMNSRLDTIQAAIMLPKLEVLEDEMDKRQKIARSYNEAFSEHFGVPITMEDSRSSYAQYVLFCNNEEERDEIQNKLRNKGIPTIRYYPNPLHLLPVFDGINIYDEDLRRTVEYAKCTFGIPFSPYMSDDDHIRVIESVLGSI